MQATNTNPISARKIIVAELFNFGGTGRLAISAALPWSPYIVLMAFGKDPQFAGVFPAWLVASLPTMFWLCAATSAAYAAIMCSRSLLPAMLLWFAVLPCWLFAPAAVAWGVLAGSLVATLLFSFGFAARGR